MENPTVADSRDSWDIQFPRLVETRVRQTSRSGELTMPPSDPDASEPQRPQPGQRRAYQPPPGAAKPQSPPPETVESAARAAAAAPMSGGPGGRPAMPPGAAAAAAAKRTGPSVGLRGAAYEYSFEQDGLIKELAKNISTVSWVLLALALILLVRNAKPLFAALSTQSWGEMLDPAIAFLGAGVLIYSFIGLRQSGGTFALIPESQGQDQQLTVQGLRSLNKLFSALSLIVIAIGILIAISIAIGAFAASGGKPVKKKDAAKAKTAAVQLETMGLRFPTIA